MVRWERWFQGSFTAWEDGIQGKEKKQGSSEMLLSPLSAQLSTNKGMRRELSSRGVRIKQLEFFLQSRPSLRVCVLEGVMETPFRGGHEVRAGQPAHLEPIPWHRDPFLTLPSALVACPAFARVLAVEG